MKKKEKEEKATLYEDIYDSIKKIDDFEIERPQRAAEIYRSYYDSNKNDSEQAINEMYNALTKQNQFVINNMITYFMPEKNKNGYICHFYNKLKEHLKITDYAVAQVIFSKMNCKRQNCYSEKENLVEDNIKKMLERIGNKDLITAKNIEILSIFCEAFSLDKNILFSGQGCQILLNENKIESLLKEKNIELSDFIKKVFERKCKTCPNKDCDNYNREIYTKYLYYDKMELARMMAELLNVSTMQIIETIPIILTIEEDSFIDRYGTLSDNSKKVINELMKNLYHIQYTTFIGQYSD